MFRKKPVEVEAVQLTDAHIAAHLFEKEPLPQGVTLGGANYHPGMRKVWSTRFYVETLHGRVEVKAGDWILPEPEPGKFYPVAPDVFEATYESASPAPQETRE
jgi:hypothetical protein